MVFTKVIGPVPNQLSSSSQQSNIELCGSYDLEGAARSYPEFSCRAVTVTLKGSKKAW
jgi:hypothetical protein